MLNAKRYKAKGKLVELDNNEIEYTLNNFIKFRVWTGIKLKTYIKLEKCWYEIDTDNRLKIINEDELKRLFKYKRYKLDLRYL